MRDMTTSLFHKCSVGGTFEWLMLEKWVKWLIVWENLRRVERLDFRDTEEAESTWMNDCGFEDEKKKQSLLSHFLLWVIIRRVMVISLIRGGLVWGLGKMLRLVLDLFICVKGMSMENELYTKTSPPIVHPEVLIS